MHPVDPWLVIFVAGFQFVIGGAIGFNIGINYMLKRWQRAGLRQRPDPKEKP